MCRDCGCSTASVFRSERKSVQSVGAFRSADAATDTPRSVTNSNSVREIKVEESIFLKNQGLAALNRKRFADSKTRVFNFMSSPGAGKTTLLSKLLPLIKNESGLEIVVLVGDQETSLDANRLMASGLDAIQINTHSSCHLDAARVIEHLPNERLATADWVVIENVGNLVCPAVFDLGEKIKVALLSVTEGEEKPLKYPVLFQDANLIIVTKTDLLPHLDFDSELLVSNLRSQNPNAPIIFTSSKDGHGLTEIQAALKGLS